MSQKKAQIPLKQEIPGGEDRKILLHACCAPCSGAIIEYMLREGIRPAVFFSNANIFPVKEYEIRREECRRWCEKNGLTFIDDDYDHPHWQSITKGLEKEPERGRRCLQCFRFRLERAARYAHEHGSPGSGPAACSRTSPGGEGTGGPAACSSAAARSSGNNASTTSCTAAVSSPWPGGPTAPLKCLIIKSIEI